MMRINQAYWLLYILVISLTSCYYDQSNANKLIDPIIINKPEVKKEINYILQLKEKVENWEKSHHKIMRDGFNPLISDKKRFDKPVKGGELHIRYSVEPKVLTPWLDNSAVTRYIGDYIFDTLLSENQETLKLEPSLAKSYQVDDIVWLKGHRGNSVFKEKGDNNYLIGQINENQIKWNKAKTKINSLTLKTKQGYQVITKDMLRYKTDIENPDDPNDDYVRAYDKGVVITFHLRKDVKWHDGQPFNADDVIFSMDVIKNKYIAELTPMRTRFESLKVWEKIDTDTIKFYFDKQHFQVLNTVSNFLVLPKHIYMPKNVSLTQKEFAGHFLKDSANLKPVGTGSYYFPSDNLPYWNKEKGWKKSNYIMLIRNDHYFNPPRRGYLKKLYFHIIPDNETAFLELKNGNIDFEPSMTITQFFESSTSKQFKNKFAKAFYYVGNFGYIGYNMKKIYFRDKRVRTAMTMLLDRERILKNLAYGLGKIVSGSQNYFGPAYNHAVKAYPYNRNRAMTLLNEAGWIDTDGDGIRDKEGIPFEVELLYPNSTPSATTILLSEEAKSVGIQLKLTRLEWGVFLSHLQDRRFDLCILGWAIGMEDDPYQIWHSSQWANKGSNHVGFQNKEVDQLILNVRRTLDAQKRQKLFYRIHEILHDEQPYLFLYTGPNKAVYHNRFRNVKFYRVRPGYDFREWFIPLDLQSEKEKLAEGKTS